MKPGDIASVSHIALPPTVTVLEVDGDWVAVWWPCTEYGRHTKLVPKAWLTVIEDKGSAERHSKRPKRTRDSHQDFEKLEA